MTVVIAYIPVLHKGYERFLRRNASADLLLLFGDSTINAFEWLSKDLRCLTPELACKAIQSWEIFSRVDTLDNFNPYCLTGGDVVIMPDETECRMYANQFLLGVDVQFQDVSLRYDKKKTESSILPRATDVSSDLAISMMNLAIEISTQSRDWFLRVGAVLVKEGEVCITACNEHRPSEREALFEGDPRSNFRRGVNIELSVSDHAERVVVSSAARYGVITEGADLYVTTFPCPPCAGAVAFAGIKRLFFKDGYSMMQASDQILLAREVEIFRVCL